MPIHIRAEPGEYSEACLLPGDPLRAKYIAETYFDDVKQRNSERGLLGYSGTCAAISKADYTEQAARIAVPTLCIAGDQDGSTPPELVRSLADLIPGARYEVIEGTAHIPCIEAPGAYAALVRGFLEELES